MASPTLPDVLDPWREVIHPAALILPRPSASEYAELKASIERQGLLTPLMTFVDNNGESWLLDGVSRLQAMLELGHKVLDEEGGWFANHDKRYEREGADPYELVSDLNVKRRHLTPEQKREVIRRLREERPGLTDAAIARLADVSPGTVAAERRAQEAEEPDLPQDDGYREGETFEAQEGEPAAPVIPAEPIERVDEHGRPARGRRPISRKDLEAAADATGLPTKPFRGTVLPSAAKTSRIAEARRCVKYLLLTVDDLQRPAANA